MLQEREDHYFDPLDRFLITELFLLDIENVFNVLQIHHYIDISINLPISPFSWWAALRVSVMTGEG